MCAAVAQLGERQTEDLKVPGSIPGLGIFFSFFHFLISQQNTVLNRYYVAVYFTTIMRAFTLIQWIK